METNTWKSQVERQHTSGDSWQTFQYTIDSIGDSVAEATAS